MLTYNTAMEPLIMPEYGRHIQDMIDFCLQIPDRETRTACAYTIADTMETLFPPQGDKNEYRKKIWDHLAAMSGYRLDVDAPFPMNRSVELDEPPAPVAKPGQAASSAKCYGVLIPALVDKICQMPEGEERDALISLTANQMKKLQLAINKDGVEDKRIFADLYRLSKGAIRLDPEKTRLRIYQNAPQQNGKKKKKKQLSSL